MAEVQHAFRKNVESISQQLQSAWKKGAKVKIEELLSNLDSGSLIQSDEPAMVRLIQCELELRRQYGQTVSIEEYETRFPSLSPQLLRDLVSCPPPMAVAEGKPPSLFPSRYQKQEIIGQGGIGQVWRVFDEHMNRPLAIKFSRRKGLASRLVSVRLEREAILTGSLQHPGVPPVFDHGKLNDGTEYFSMRLVEGETLGSILDKRSVNSEHDDLPSLVAIFEQICQTIAYAHSQQIVHRDLKPQNVMVGKFGEVQVMDWGMGKRIGDTKVPPQHKGKDESPASINAAKETLNRSKDSSLFDREYQDPLVRLTQTGELFGTPAFMPPEQARGEIDAIGPASDVFGLGAILFSILTGSQLYGDLGVESVLAKAANGDLSSSLETLAKAKIDPELRQLCIDCLHADASHRPANGSVVAARITAYQEGVARRLQEAQVEQEAAEVRIAEERKRRKITTWLSGAILGVFSIGLAGVLWQWNEANEATGLAQRRLIDTEDAQALAEQRLNETRKVVDEYYSKIADAKGLLSRTPGTQKLRRELLEKARVYYVRYVEENGDDDRARFETAAACQRLAVILQELNPGGVEVLDIRNEQIAILTKLINESGDEVEGRYFENLADAHYALALAYASRADNDLAMQEYENAEKIIRQWIDFSDSDHARFQLAKTEHNYGRIKRFVGEYAEALERYENALAIADPILTNNLDESKTAEYLLNVATMNQSIGTFHGWYHPTNRDWSEALKYTQLALAMYEEAAKLEPENPESMQRVVSVLNNVGMIHYNLKIEGESKDIRIRRCRESFDRAVEVGQQMAEENGSIPEYSRLLAKQFGNYATFLNYNGDLEGSKKKLRQSAMLYKKIALAHPQVNEYSDEAIKALELVAAIQGRCVDSEAAVEDAIKIFDQLVSDTPGNDQNSVQCALRKAIATDTPGAELLDMTSSVDDLKDPADSRLASRALAFYRSDRFEDARQTLERIEPRKEFALRWLVSALVHVRLGDREQAEELYQKAKTRLEKQKRPTDRDYYMLLLEEEYLNLVGD